jgi:hypothetical protein
MNGLRLAACMMFVYRPADTRGKEDSGWTNAMLYKHFD